MKKIITLCLLLTLISLPVFAGEKKPHKFGLKFEIAEGQEGKPDNRKVMKMITPKGDEYTITMLEMYIELNRMEHQIRQLIRLSSIYISSIVIVY